MLGLVLSRKATETPRMGSAGACSTPERKEGPAAAQVLIAIRSDCAWMDGCGGVGAALARGPCEPWFVRSVGRGKA